MDKLKKVLVGNDSSPSEEVNFAAQVSCIDDFVAMVGHCPMDSRLAFSGGGIE